MDLQYWTNHFKSKLKTKAKKFVEENIYDLVIPNPLNPIDIASKRKIAKILKIPYTPKEKELNEQALNHIKQLLPARLSLEEWKRTERELQNMPARILEFFNTQGTNSELVLQTSIQEMGEISDKTLEHCYQLGVTLLMDGEYEAAMSLFHLLRMLAPSREVFWIALAVSMKRLRQYDDLETLLKFANTLFPHSVRLRIHQADFYRLKNDPLLAKKTLTQAEKIASELKCTEEISPLIQEVSDKLRRVS